MTPKILETVTFCMLAASAVSLASAGQAFSRPGQVRAVAPTGQNRSELSQGTLVVHVSKIQNSSATTRQSGAFAMSINGPQQGAPEVITATKGHTFLTVFFSAKAASYGFELDTAEILLAEPNGATISPVSFSDLNCEFCMSSVLGVKIGGPKSSSDTFGPYSVTFSVPEAGQDGLPFRVSGIDVGTIRELKHLLSPVPAARPKPPATPKQ